VIDMMVYFINFLTFETNIYLWNTNEYRVFQK